MNQSLPPTVCLDGTAIRRIREEKKLTQLYMAKVVGVTTDTISRWENNRYPSIKKENALRLAEALEVSIEDILEGKTGECPLSDRPRTSRRPFYLAFLALLVLIALAGLHFFFDRQEVFETGFIVERLLPKYAAPGSIIPVRVQLRTEGEKEGFVLREHFPQGWKLIEANPPASSLDNEHGTVRWIIKSGESPRLIAYLIKVEAGAELGKEASFRGEVVVRLEGSSTPIPVSGTAQMQVAPFQWADLNGDNRIDDCEMLEASDIVDEIKGVHIDWNQLEEIWDAGSYRWDKQQRRFFPVRFLPQPSG